jgi:hypothetical protein
MGKHKEAEESGNCYNCDEHVGCENIVVNHETRWPVCRDCDFELSMENSNE